MPSPGASPLWRRRHQIALLLAAAAALHVAWRYRARRPQWPLLQRLAATLSSAHRALALASDIGALLLADAHSYLSADADELPRSFKQCLKLLASAPVHEALASVGRSLLANQGTSGPGVVDKLIEASLSPRGQSLITLCVSRGCSDVAGALADRLCSEDERAAAQPAALDRVLGWLATPAGRALVDTAVTAFVSRGVAVYCDKTAGANTYDDLFASLTKAEHLRTLQALTQTFCSTSVLAAFGREAAPPLTPRPADERNRIPFSMHDDRDNIVILAAGKTPTPIATPPPAPPDSGGGGGWQAAGEQLIRFSKLPEMRSLMSECSHAGCAGVVEGAVAAASGGGAFAGDERSLAASRDAEEVSASTGDDWAALGRSPELRELVREFAFAGFSGGAQAGVRALLEAVGWSGGGGGLQPASGWCLLLVLSLLVCLHVLSPSPGLLYSEAPGLLVGRS